MLLSWCGWHMQVLRNFYENVDMKMIRSIWSPWPKELGATAMKMETMPWQRPGSDNSWRNRCKRSGRERVIQGWWGAPGFRVPTERRHGNRGGTWNDNSETVQPRATQTTHAFVPRTSFSAVIPSKRAFGAERVRSGSSCSRVIVEVVVLATVMEVVVHVGGSCSGSWRVVM